MGGNMQRDAVETEAAPHETHYDGSSSQLGFEASFISASMEKPDCHIGILVGWMMLIIGLM